MDREAARVTVHDVVEEMSAYLSQGDPPDLSEADTRAYFVEPIIRALGWTGIGTVQREYFVRSSQEFIDYVMYVSGGRELAIETKRIKAPLNEKHAAQLIQYCSVEGIEWAALTNGRQWQAFNIYLRPDVQAKRLYQIDLLDSNDEVAFGVLFEQLWLLSRGGFPSAIREWLGNKLFDSAMRAILSNPRSRTIRAALEELKSASVTSRPQDVVKWFQSRIVAAEQKASISEPTPVLSASDVRNLPVADSVNTNERVIDRETTTSARTARDLAGKAPGKKSHYGIRIVDLLRSSVLSPGTRLILMARGREIASAEVDAEGQIVYEGRRYPTPSHPDFAHLKGRQASNGWADWHAVLPDGHRSLLELRERYLHLQKE